MKSWIVLGVVLLLLAPTAASQAGSTSNPNIVVILADDLGYGDLGCYGATKVKTPNIDRLAREGRRFTDAHSASAVCTPSRYALLTGEYPFRRNLFGPVMNQSPLVVDPSRATVASLLKRQGYATACFGKWHLGFGRQTEAGLERRPEAGAVGVRVRLLLRPAGGEQPSAVRADRESPRAGTRSRRPVGVRRRSADAEVSGEDDAAGDLRRQGGPRALPGRGAGHAVHGEGDRLDARAPGHAVLPLFRNAAHPPPLHAGAAVQRHQRMRALRRLHSGVRLDGRRTDAHARRVASSATTRSSSSPATTAVC